MQGQQCAAYVVAFVAAAAAAAALWMQHMPLCTCPSNHFAVPDALQLQCNLGFLLIVLVM
jgi:hypothetical protein